MNHVWLRRLWSPCNVQTSRKLPVLFFLSQSLLAPTLPAVSAATGAPRRCSILTVSASVSPALSTFLPWVFWSSLDHFKIGTSLAHSQAMTDPPFLFVFFFFFPFLHFRGWLEPGGPWNYATFSPVWRREMSHQGSGWEVCEAET